MSTGASTRPRDRVARILRRDNWRVWAWTSTFALVFLVGPLLAAGTVRWPAFWACLSLVAVSLTFHQVFVERRNPGLLQRRMQVGAGTPRWDMAWHFVFWPLVGTVLIVAGLEFRMSGVPMPPAGFAAGVVLLAAGLVLSGRAMACNPFFEGTARIQSDRGQYVVDAGPYRVLRHPGYAGLCLGAVALPFLLLSWWAFAGAAAVVAAIVVRTALEDRMLRDALPGYADYARRVRRRLVPGIW